MGKDNIKTPNVRDLVKNIAQGNATPPPIARLIGFTVREAQDGRAVVEFEAGEQHTNPMGSLHGGVLCYISDAAMGMAYASNLNEGESFTTLELKINFVKPVWKARLRAVARVIKQGKTIGLVECDVLDEKDQLVAHSTCTQMTLRGEQAVGR